MNAREIGRSLFGATIVYVVMAACGNWSSQQTAAAGPTVAFTPCDHVYPGGGDIRWAEKEFPGKTVADLAGLHAIAHRPIPDGGAPEGINSDLVPGYYEYVLDLRPILLKDGSAAVACNGSGIDSILFVLPGG